MHAEERPGLGVQSEERPVSEQFTGPIRVNHRSVARCDLAASGPTAEIRPHPPMPILRAGDDGGWDSWQDCCIANYIVHVLRFTLAHCWCFMYLRPDF